MALTPAGTYALLVLGASIQDRTQARLAFLALIPFALGIAALEVGVGASDPQVVHVASRSGQDVFVAINTGLLLLGAFAAALGALAGLRDRRASLAGWALLAAAALGVWVSVSLIPPGKIGHVFVTVFAGAALAALGGLGIRHLPHDRRAPVRPTWWPGIPGNRALAVAFGLGALTVALGPWVGMTFLGLFIAALADYLDRRVKGEVRFPWLPVAVGVLAPVLWLMATIAGPVGLRIADLAAVPLSPRAEILLALPLALVVWACFGLWPAQRLFPTGLMPALGAVLWLRVAASALADGLQHWQPVLMPLAALGVLGAAIGNAGGSALNGLGFLVLASDTPRAGAGTGVWALVLVAAGLLVGRPTDAPTPVRAALERLGWAASALVLPMALAAGLRGQVTYTLLAVVGLALAVWRGAAGMYAATARRGPEAM